eukprot:1159234-Pelagomonas_calceolata.AAC.3
MMESSLPVPEHPFLRCTGSTSGANQSNNHGFSYPPAPRLRHAHPHPRLQLPPPPRPQTALPPCPQNGTGQLQVRVHAARQPPWHGPVRACVHNEEATSFDLHVSVMLTHPLPWPAHAHGAAQIWYA